MVDTLQAKFVVGEGSVDKAAVVRFAASWMCVWVEESAGGAHPGGRNGPALLQRANHGDQDAEQHGLLLVVKLADDVQHGVGPLADGGGFPPPGWGEMDLDRSGVGGGR